jgi:hypothetical protein
MSKTDTLNDHHRTLTDTELDAVSGGTTVGALGYTSHIPMGLPVPTGGSPSLLEAAIRGAISGASGAL